MQDNLTQEINHLGLHRWTNLANRRRTLAVSGRGRDRSVVCASTGPIAIAVATTISTASTHRRRRGGLRNTMSLSSAWADRGQWISRHAQRPNQTSDRGLTGPLGAQPPHGHAGL